MERKRRKEAFEVPCVCFNVLPEAFRQYSERMTFEPTIVGVKSQICGVSS